MEKTTKHIGVVGVDSGQLLLCDPCYIGEEIPTYDKLCSIEGQIRYKLGHPGAGIKLSGFGGDGIYEVDGVYENGFLVSVTIRFRE